MEANQRADHVHLVVVTPYEKFFEGDVDFVVLPTSEGEHGILPNHAPIVVAIYPGSLRIRREDSWRYAFISNGYAQVGQDYTVVICNAAEWADKIDVERSRANLDRNTKRLATVAPEDRVNRMRYRHAVRRAKNRIHVAELYGQRAVDPIWHTEDDAPPENLDSEEIK